MPVVTTHPGPSPNDPPAQATAPPLLHRVGALLPAGRALPTDLWNTRHKGIILMLYVHAIGLAIFGLYMEVLPVLVVGEAALIVFTALVASWGRLGRRFRSSVAAFGAVTSSALLVQFSGGYIEAHFHFFVMVAVIALYQDWVPFMIAVVYVALDHGVIGTLFPEWVYNHPDAIAHPWKWAAIHAVLVSGQCLALLALWKSAEKAQEHVAERQVEIDRMDRESRFKSLLLTNVSHELKTPLTPLRLNVQMLKRGKIGPLEERQERVVALLDRNLDRLTTLVDQTLDVSRLDMERLNLNPRSVDLRELVEHAVEDHESHAVSRGLTIDLQAPEPVPMQADPDRITQVIHNLVSNAVKFSTSGGRITIRVRNRPEDNEALLEVQDTGRGLETEERQQLFQPFVQVHDIHSMTDAGSGLGLYLSRGIVEHHGGRIWCRSEGHGKGSTFCVTLPLSGPKAAPGPHAAAVAPAIRQLGT